MNTHQVIAISLALILGVSGADAADEATSETLITVNISDETLSEIFDQLGTQYGYTIGFTPELGDRRGPHLYVAPTPALRAFEIVAAAYGACAVVDNNLVRILPCDVADRLRDALAFGIRVENRGTAYPTTSSVRGAVVSGIYNEQGAGYEQ